MSLEIAHIMTKEVITAEAGCSLKEAVDLMNTFEIGSIVILEKGMPVGIVTERDLLKKVLANSEQIKKMKVDEIMSTPIITTQPEEKVEDAAERMLQKRIKKLPVTKNGKLIGMVTLTDLFRFEPELIRSYTILMRARIEPNVLTVEKLKTNR